MMEWSNLFQIFEYEPPSRATITAGFSKCPASYFLLYSLQDFLQTVDVTFILFVKII